METEKRGEIMFLETVKVKNFAHSKRVCVENSEYGGRQVYTIPNDKPDDIFHVIGVTSLKDGATHYDSEDGLYFAATKSHKVYIVAKSIGRRYKVLEEDLERLEVHT